MHGEFEAAVSRTLKRQRPTTNFLPLPGVPLCETDAAHARPAITGAKSRGFQTQFSQNPGLVEKAIESDRASVVNRAYRPREMRNHPEVVNAIPDGGEA